MKWDDYYQKLYECKSTTMVRYLYELEDLGNGDEVNEVIQEIYFDAPNGANQLLRKAIDYKVKFSIDNIIDLSNICDETLVNQVVLFAKEYLKQEDLNKLAGFIDDDLLFDDINNDDGGLLVESIKQLISNLVVIQTGINELSWNAIRDVLDEDHLFSLATHQINSENEAIIKQTKLHILTLNEQLRQFDHFDVQFIKIIDKWFKLNLIKYLDVGNKKIVKKCREGIKLLKMMVDILEE